MAQLKDLIVDSNASILQNLIVNGEIQGKLDWKYIQNKPNNVTYENATESQAGLVSTNEQHFGGIKHFHDSILTYGTVTVGQNDSNNNGVNGRIYMNGYKQRQVIVGLMNKAYGKEDFFIYDPTVPSSGGADDENKKSILSSMVNEDGSLYNRFFGTASNVDWSGVTNKVNASASTAGLMSAAHYSALANKTSDISASTLVTRNSNGTSTFHTLILRDLDGDTNSGSKLVIHNIGARDANGAVTKDRNMYIGYISNESDFRIYDAINQHSVLRSTENADGTLSNTFYGNATSATTASSVEWANVENKVNASDTANGLMTSTQYTIIKNRNASVSTSTMVMRNNSGNSEFHQLILKDVSGTYQTGSKISIQSTKSDGTSRSVWVGFPTDSQLFRIYDTTNDVTILESSATTGTILYGTSTNAKGLTLATANYGSTLPASGTTGQVFFKLI